jgi:transposase
VKRLYKKGPDRSQRMILPPSIDEFIHENNPVKAIDYYVNSLDLMSLGFAHAQGSFSAGQPPYDPSDLLKLYLYGYLNRIRSSRKLEQETHRNLEVIWLIRGIKPTYKTIADFRKNNLKALKAVNKDFVLACRELELYGGELIGIDGSHFRGNASKGSIYLKKTLQKQIKKIDRDIDEYLKELEAGDAQSPATELEDPRLKEKLEKLQKRQREYHEKLAMLEESGEKQLSMTDEDARLISKKGGQTIAGYNVQSVVDDKHKLLVVCEVVNDGNDLQQLGPMAQKAQETLETQEMTVVADSGYYNQDHLKDCLDEGITPYVAIPDKTKPTREQGRFCRDDFTFDHEGNRYRCPGGEHLEQDCSFLKSGKRLIRYSSKAKICAQCPLCQQCLPDKTPYRQIYRWEHEEIVEAHRQRMEREGQEYMKKRAALVEHPFGTLKQWLGWTHFLLRGLEKVQGEMDFLMLTYNFKRVLNIIGIPKLIAYFKARARARKPEGAPGLIHLDRPLHLYLFLVRIVQIKTHLAMQMMILVPTFRQVSSKIRT